MTRTQFVITLLFVALISYLTYIDFIRIGSIHGPQSKEVIHPVEHKLTLEVIVVQPELPEVGIVQIVPEPKQEPELPIAPSPITARVPIMIPPSFHDGTFEDHHRSKTYGKRDWVKSAATAELRQVDYGIGTSIPLMIKTHEGGKRMDDAALMVTIAGTLQRMPNIKSSVELRALIYEMFVVETDLGRHHVDDGIRRWNNYGHAQFRLDTLEHLLWWLALDNIRPDVHKAVMALADPEQDLVWNIKYNVPFQIACAVQYFWMRVPDLNNNIGTLIERAEVYKVEYNSSKGLATVEKYIERVEAAYKRVAKNEAKIKTYVAELGLK